MDTREKIVPLENLATRLGNAQWLAVLGKFDPLTLTQANRLAELSKNGRSLIAVVEPSTQTLLPAEARAVLLAALRSVQLVVIARPSELPLHPQIDVVEDEDGERRRTAEFVQLITQRHGVLK